MRTFLFAITLFMVSPLLFAQEDGSKIAQGDVLTLNKNGNAPFKHVAFPRANFIIKKGGIADYKSVDGMQVRVKELTTNANGHQVAVLVPVSGKKFFNRYKKVTANLDKALESQELLLPAKS